MRMSRVITLSDRLIMHYQTIIRPLSDHYQEDDGGEEDDEDNELEDGLFGNNNRGWA